MSFKPRVIQDIVENDLCIGCGLCVYKCGSDALSMAWNKEGFLVAELADICEGDEACIGVCPFNPNPDVHVKNEAVLAEKFLPDGSEHERLGRLIGIYAGYSHEFRSTASSGGIATFIFKELLERNIVQHVVSVNSVEDDGAHYRYSISSNVQDLIKTSKTKYYPVTLADVMSEITKLNGAVAISGVACFVKALRLAQSQDLELKKKIAFIAGIICGGMKSKFFTEYLASKANANPVNIVSPLYRIKENTAIASDYSFGCFDVGSKEDRRIKMKDVGDMWGTGYFKANACDYCEDVTTELADISLGDAWLEPYSQDGRGTSVIITRTPLAEELIRTGSSKGCLAIEVLSPQKMRESQQGSYNHRHEGLNVRLNEARKRGVKIAEKRYGRKRVTVDILFVQKMRRLTRKKSLTVWQEQKSAEYFDSAMHRTLWFLKLATKITHYKRRLTKS